MILPRRILLISSFLFLALASWGAGPQEHPPEESPEESPTAAVILPAGAEQRVEHLVWTRHGTTGTVHEELEEDQGRAVLPAGEGCLILLRSGRRPVALEQELGPGAVVDLQDRVRWAPGVSVRGQILGQEGAPVGASARIRREEAGSRPETLCERGLRLAGITEVETASDGSFRLGPLDGGPFELLAAAAGHGEVTRRLVLDPSSGERLIDPILLQPVCHLRLEIIGDALEIPPPYTVELARENEGWVSQRNQWKPVVKAETDELSALEVEVRPGSYRFVVTASETDLFSVHYAQLDPGPAFHSLEPRPFLVEGRALRDSEGVEGVKVVLVTDAVEVEAMTDSDGEYEVRLWTPGHYAVAAFVPDGGVVPSHIDLAEAEAGETYSHDIELPSASLSGRVVSREDRSPISLASVRLQQTSTEEDFSFFQAAETDAEGRFSFKGLRESAVELRIEVSAEGFLQAERQVRPDEGEVWVELEPSQTTEGMVVGPAGEPVRGATVGCCATVPGGPLTVRVAADMSGRFTIDAADGAVLFARAPGYTIGWVRAASTGDELLLRLGARGPSTTIRLTDQDASPLVGKALVFSAADGAVIPAALMFEDARSHGADHRTGNDGVVSIESLPMGTYRALLPTSAGLVPVGVVLVPASGVVPLTAPEP